MPARVSIQDPGTIGRVPGLTPGVFNPLGIFSGRAVRGATWSDVARALNYLNGSPRTLIPYCAPQLSLLSSDGAQTFRFKVWPSYQATHRLWVVTLGPLAQDEAIGTEFEFTDPSAGTSTWRCSGGGGAGAPQTFEHVETVASRVTVETELAPVLESVTGNHVVEGIACIELPRPSLAIDANDLGLELASFGGGAPISDGIQGYSIGALPEALAGALSRGRRHLFQWAVTTGKAGFFTTSSGTLQDVLGDYDPPILERQIYSDDAQEEIEARFYARVTGSAAGVIQVTMANGDTATVAVTSTSWGWLTMSGLLVDAEDISTSDGRRSTRWDQALIQARVTSGTGTVDIASVSLVGRGS